MEELKPCPFCGGRPVEHYPGGTAYGIECEDCHIGTSYVCLDQHEKAIEAWNRREYELERDELLDIADEMESFSEREYCAYGIDEPTCNKLSSFSDRIRKAFGVE